VAGFVGILGPAALLRRGCADGRPTFLLTFYLFLAFPMGRLEPPTARWLMAALTLAVVAFFVPWALCFPVIAAAGR
jgi:hypothetical protein